MHQTVTRTSAAEIDLGSIAGIAAAKRAGLLHPRFDQSPEEFDAQKAAFISDAIRGVVANARPRRQLDYNRRTGTYVTRSRLRGGGWSRPRVVAVSRVRMAHVAAVVPAARLCGRREHRAGQRGRRVRRHASSILRDDGDGPGGESEPADLGLGGAGALEAAAPIGDGCSCAGGDGRSGGGGGLGGDDNDGGHDDLPPEDGAGDEFSEWEVRRAANHVAAEHPHRLTPGLLDDACDPFVYGLSFDKKGGAKARIFLALPAPLRASFWSEVGEQLRRASEVSPRAARALGYHVDVDSEGDAS